jgi:hypothetical protein
MKYIISIDMIEISSIVADVMHDSLHKPVQRAHWLDVVAEQVGKLRFGVVQIVVHDSRVVQIDRTEKVRLTHPAEPVDGRQTS